MLILTRYIGQSFQIQLEDDIPIEVKLLDIQSGPHGQVSRIGIKAPKQFNIIRNELLRKNKSQEI